MPHICKLQQYSYHTGLAIQKQKMWWFLKVITLSKKHPKTSILFYSSSDRDKEIMAHLKSKHYTIIHPFSLFRLYWEVYMYWVFLAAFIILPLNILRRKIPKDNDEETADVVEFFGVSTTIIDVLCFLDMFITLHTGYDDGRAIVKSHAKIRKNYLKSIYFVTDLISSFPVEFCDLIFSYYPDRFHFFRSTIIPYAHLLALIKIFRIQTFLDYGEMGCHVLKLGSTVKTIIRIINVVIIFTHWFACLNFIIPSYVYTSTSKHFTWIWAVFDRIPGMTELYYACFFRAISTLTVTFSDEYKERNNVEGIISCAGLVFSIILNGVILIIIVSILLNMSSTRINYAIYKDQVKKYMFGKDLKLDLQKRVLEFIDYTYNGLYFNEKYVNEILSQKLLQDIAIYRGQKLLQNTILLKLPYIHMRHVLCHMKEEAYTPNDSIIKAGTKGTCMYFIASGTVVIKSPAGKEICHLQTGEYFGEISLVFKGQRRTADVQALEYCCLFRLDKKLFHTRIATHDNIMQEMRTKASERMALTERLNAIHLQLLLQKVKTVETDEY